MARSDADDAGDYRDDRIKKRETGGNVNTVDRDDLYIAMFLVWLATIGTLLVGYLIISAIS